MRLEDALLQLDVEAAALGDGLEAFCRAAIQGGVDLVRLRVSPAGSAEPAPEETARRVADVCRREDAVFVVQQDAGVASAAGADGVHLEGAEAPVGEARAVIGLDAIVGVTVKSADDAVLALEIGVDYLVLDGGADGLSALNAVRPVARVPVYVGGVGSCEQAKEIVESGVLRLCVEGKTVPGDDVAEHMAAYSRVLGRCM